MCLMPWYHTDCFINPVYYTIMYLIPINRIKMYNTLN